MTNDGADCRGVFYGSALFGQKIRLLKRSFEVLSRDSLAGEKIPAALSKIYHQVYHHIAGFHDFSPSLATAGERPPAGLTWYYSY